MFRIMLVDDHPLFRLGLRKFLEREADFSVVHENDNAMQSWSFFSNNPVDLIICDLSLQEGSGLSLVRRIRSSGSLCPILILSMHEEGFWAERVLQEGVNGYLMKDKHISTVIAAARTVLRGEIYLEKSIQQKIFRRLSGISKSDFSLDTLSGRENDIFQCMAQGMSTNDISTELFISVKTVQTHQSNIKKKLRLSTLNDLRNLASKYSEIEIIEEG